MKTLREFAKEIDGLLATGVTPEGMPGMFGAEDMAEMFTAFVADRQELRKVREGEGK